MYEGVEWSSICKQINDPTHKNGVVEQDKVVHFNVATKKKCATSEQENMHREIIQYKTWVMKIQDERHNDWLRVRCQHIS